MGGVEIQTPAQGIHDTQLINLCASDFPCGPRKASWKEEAAPPLLWVQNPPRTGCTYSLPDLMGHVQTVQLQLEACGQTSWLCSNPCHKGRRSVASKMTKGGGEQLGDLCADGQGALPGSALPIPALTPNRVTTGQMRWDQEDQPR